ncbi:Fic/DOC family N-terminal domain-containing protein [Helicobacter sp. 13S00477-4]|uniref:Fic family protein n=1 Tax=Helicobacter sp. 13S00477-4 TaxID=1905759 RepID=UPI000BA73D66|nr:Fic/DOC family N-terminal domain-containing protein [Helicobacter sp. 13S00477-4]PAF52818.1 addiction module protein [Helicobacter sp. 13S00477-4]
MSIDKGFLPQELPIQINLTPQIYQKLINASRALGNLNGFMKIIPNQNILINSLILQEAKDSSEIENIITTHTELFLTQASDEAVSQNAKEVQDYSRALKKGFELIKKDGLFLNKHILEIQQELEQNNAGFRKQSGTILKNPSTNEVKYIPPQDYNDILHLMKNLEKYINSDMDSLDPLIRMSMIHYQFESIHPFYDGNGRTGRILNILYLVYMKVLDLPILYLSAYIIQTKNIYYDLLQKVREENKWVEWIIYILEGVEKTAIETIKMIKYIDELIKETSDLIQLNAPKIYSKDLVELIFSHPYTKINFILDKIDISRQTASKYLKICQKLGILECRKIGRNHFYINTKLVEIFQRGICVNEIDFF